MSLLLHLSLQTGVRGICHAFWLWALERMDYSAMTAGILLQGRDYAILDLSCWVLCEEVIGLATGYTRALVFVRASFNMTKR
jgi:hypothetical protein